MRLVSLLAFALALSTFGLTALGGSPFSFPKASFDGGGEIDIDSYDAGKAWRALPSASGGSSALNPKRNTSWGFDWMNQLVSADDANGDGKTEIGGYAMPGVDPNCRESGPSVSGFHQIGKWHITGLDRREHWDQFNVGQPAHYAVLVMDQDAKAMSRLRVLMHDDGNKELGVALDTSGNNPALSVNRDYPCDSAGSWDNPATRTFRVFKFHVSDGAVRKLRVVTSYTARIPKGWGYLYARD
jgi:hypothetical protein